MSNSATSNSQPILDKIHSKGYWRVVIHPTVFEPLRIASIPELKSTIEACVVALRGWSYPHVGGFAHLEIGQDHIQGASDFRDHIEFFRWYQSGQFVHHLAMREDHAEKDGKWLYVPWTLATFTEVYEFAGRLAAKGILIPGAVIDVSLHGLTGRSLYGQEYWPQEDFTCAVGDLSTKGTYSADALFKNGRSHAVTKCTEVLHKFGWTELREEMLREEQRKLLEQKI